MRMFSRLTNAAPILAFAMLVSTNIASAQKTNTVQYGTTTVTFASTLIPTMNSLGLTLGPVSPSNIRNGVVSFSANSGAIDLVSGAAQVLHSGGLTVTAGQTVITLQGFIVDTTAGTPVITGLVSLNGTLIGRLPIFDLVIPGGLIVPLTPTRNGQLNIASINVTLDSTMAGILNTTFSSLNSPFSGGDPIGTATVSVYVHP